jgi:hypothetical protein
MNQAKQSAHLGASHVVSSPLRVVPTRVCVGLAQLSTLNPNGPKNSRLTCKVA